MLKKFDILIIKKFLSTFFLAIALILAITIVFDISEKIKQLLASNPPISEIAVYYLTFLPFFANLFSPLFTFISVVYFTSRMASNTEIIAVINAGVSYRRFLRPYLITALFIGTLSFYLANFLIPQTNVIKNDFTQKYLERRSYYNTNDIHKQNSDDELVYMQRFNYRTLKGQQFTLEKFKDGGRLISKLKANEIIYDTISQDWILKDYHIRYLLADGSDSINMGDSMIISLNVKPIDFSKATLNIEEMDFNQLREYIDYQKKIGSEIVASLELEKHKRISIPFSTIILTILAVSLTNRKSRGGIGINIVVGISLAFGFIILGQVSSVFAQFGNLDPFIAVWIPNVLFFIISIITSRYAHK